MPTCKKRDNKMIVQATGCWQLYTVNVADKCKNETLTCGVDKAKGEGECARNRFK